LSVRADANGFEFTGEGAPVYGASLGLAKFQRTLQYTAGKLTVTDSIAGSVPHVFTEMLHSDTGIQETDKDKFSIQVGDAVLHVNLKAPPDATTKIEPNVVMGPGQPGSVDKGSLETRGERLAASTAGSAIIAGFVWELTF
jgi:hypothetical protein